MKVLLLSATLAIMTGCAGETSEPTPPADEDQAPAPEVDTSKVAPRCMTTTIVCTPTGCGPVPYPCTEKKPVPVTMK